MKIISLFIFDMEDFYNTGFGWICKRCESETSESNVNSNNDLPRIWREGEAENKEATLSAPLAKWFDDKRQTLICPKCGITETIYKA